MKDLLKKDKKNNDNIDYYKQKLTQFEYELNIKEETIKE